jgi:ABC-2 type transport system permease protein
MTAFKSLSVAMAKGFLRDKAALFFTFLFPLMFLVVFGLIFRDAGAEKIKLGVVGDGQMITVIEQSGAFETRRFDTMDAAVAEVRGGELPGMVSQQGAGEVQLRFAASDQNRAGIVQGIVSGIVDKTNIAVTGQAPKFTLDAKQVEDESLGAIQYLTPGLLSWAVAFSAVFGSALTFVAWRKKQVLRRIRLAPVSAGMVLTSRIGVTLGTAIVQAVLFVGIAMLPVFGLKLSGTWYLAVPIFLLGMVAFFAIGLLVGAFAKTEDSANGAVQIVVMPMAFMSGSFFPIDQAPDWLQTVSKIFPLRHMNDGLLDFLVRGKGPEALIVPCSVLLGFALVVGVIAVRVFRWED